MYQELADSFSITKTKIYTISWTDILQVSMKLLLLITVTVLLVQVQSYDEDVFDVKQLMSRIEGLERRQVAMENRHQTELSELRSKLQGSVKLFDFYLCVEMCYFHMKNTKKIHSVMPISI